MKWLLLSFRWLLIVVSASVWGCSIYFLRVSDGSDLVACFVLMLLGYVCWPDTLLMAADKNIPCGEVYGIRYYRDWDGSRQYYRATVFGAPVVAPHEPAIRDMIFRKLTRAVAHRAVDKVIRRMV